MGQLNSENVNKKSLRSEKWLVARAASAPAADQPHVSGCSNAEPRHDGVPQVCVARAYPHRGLPVRLHLHARSRLAIWTADRAVADLSASARERIVASVWAAAFRRRTA